LALDLVQLDSALLEFSLQLVEASPQTFRDQTSISGSSRMPKLTIHESGIGVRE
jgi:hypothetical protein